MKRPPTIREDEELEQEDFQMEGFDIEGNSDEN